MGRPLYRSMVTVMTDSPVIYRDVGAMVLVEGEPFVRTKSGAMFAMSDDWQYTERDADLRVLPELKKRLKRIVELIESINNPRSLEQLMSEASAIVVDGGVS